MLRQIGALWPNTAARWRSTYTCGCAGGFANGSIEPSAALPGSRACGRCGIVRLDAVEQRGSPSCRWSVSAKNSSPTNSSASPGLRLVRDAGEPGLACRRGRAARLRSSTAASRSTPGARRRSPRPSRTSAASRRARHALHLAGPASSVSAGRDAGDELAGLGRQAGAAASAASRARRRARSRPPRRGAGGSRSSLPISCSDTRSVAVRR